MSKRLVFGRTLGSRETVLRCVAGAKFPISFQLKLGETKMKNLMFVFVVAFAFSTTAMAVDIAISTQAGWFGQEAADREMQEIVDNVTTVPVEQFAADQQDALADWVIAHTGDGVSDLLILCGNFPDTIYPPGNAEPDGSLAELFLDDGNTIVNTGDYMFYVNSGGTNNNAAGGLQNMMDIANGAIDMWDDDTPANVTAEGAAVAPSLQNFQTDRPFHLDALEGDWVPELILAQNDAGTRADPVIVVNTVTGGRLGIFYQTSGQDDDPRGEVMSEWINNYVLTGGEIPNGPASNPNPADGAVDVDTTSLEWNAGYGAVSHKVYLSIDETIDESDLAAETDLTIQLVALEDGTTYYWRVDEIDADGAVIEGNLWSFTTIPLEAHFPNPADGADSQALDVQLSWTPGKVVIMHDVYFGTDEAAIAARDMTTFKGKLMTESYDPGALAIETTYYWAVDEFTPTGTVAGPVWSFTTLGSVPITDPDLLLYYDFESGEGTAAIDQSGHSNHGQFMGDPQWATGIFGGAMDLDGDGDYLDAGTNEVLNNLSDAITVSAWVNIRSVTTTWMGIVMKGETAWRLGVNGDTTGVHWGFTGGDRGWQAANSVTELPFGEWHHIAGTYDRSVGGTVWIDGVAETVNPDPDGVRTNEQPLLLGENPEALGRLFDGLIDEVRIYNKALTGAQIQGMSAFDVTAPGDVVKGVPDEPRDGSVAGWPDGEYPGLAVDDDVSTKYLHFKGEVEPTGFVVEPASGPSVVTGLTLTTANDAIERDPATFELSGSNDSIDGPYTLIASGDIVDFAQADALPRFTMNSTPISFDNDVAYAYYQVMFPTVRDAPNANSMQIAEVELLGVPAPIARWEFDGDFEGGTPVGDISFEDDPVRGTVLSLPGGDDQYVDLGAVGISGNMPRTITVWAKADNTSIPDWTLIFGFTGTESGDGGNGSHFNIGSLGGPGGVGAHCWGWEETIFSDDEALEWHHYAMTYDGTTIQYYGDGVPMDTDLGKSNVQDLSISADRVHAGSRITQASSFPGKVDDARIYKSALSPLDISKIASE